MLLLVLVLASCQQPDYSKLSKEELFPIYAKFCAKEENPYARDDCQLTLMAYTNDSKYCDKMSELLPKSHCLSLYEQLQVGEWPKEVESIHVATFKQKGLTYQTCAAMNGSQKDQCFVDVAIGLKKPTICADVEDADQQEYCVAEVSIEMKDPQLCGALAKYKNRCFTYVAKELKDRSLCENLEEDKIKAGCHFIAAK